MVIERGTGFTESERYLSKIAERTFLKLWTYPNTFRDQGVSCIGSGKEICDLLVVCGDDIIIFSDKSISWPCNAEIGTNWSRWYSRAVQSSVKQIVGAKNWIEKNPDRIYLDVRCTKKLPVTLPSAERRRFHGVAIALGAEAACREYYKDEDGSLIIRSDLKGSDHVGHIGDVKPYFSVGDVNPAGMFIHVFDGFGLDLVMLEMNTITDFIQYLIKRTKAIRDQDIGMACSEADMLSTYMQTLDDDGSYNFPTTQSMNVDHDSIIVISQNDYQDFIRTEEYIAKKMADEVSYNWDKLINIFLDHIMAETAVTIDGYGEPMGARTEPGLRLMACENRFSRRVLSKAFLEFLSRATERKNDRFARIVTSYRNGFTNTSVIYVFMQLAYPKKITLAGGYQQYRQVRVQMLETYCYSALYENRSLQYAVGVAMDAIPNESSEIGNSEDFIAVYVPEWTEDLERDVEFRRKAHEIMQSDRLEYSRRRETEYPI